MSGPILDHLSESLVWRSTQELAEHLYGPSPGDGEKKATLDALTDYLRAGKIERRSYRRYSHQKPFSQWRLTR